MGKYFNPPEDIKDVGRAISGNSYNDLFRQLKSNEVLVGLFDRLMFKNCSCLHSEDEYNEFHSQYMQGQFVSEVFFAVDNETFEKGCI